MLGLKETSADLWEAVEAAGLDAAFDDQGRASEDCPACGARRALRLNLKTRRASCLSCAIDGPLETYLRERLEGIDPADLRSAEEDADDPPAPEPAELIVLPSRRSVPREVSNGRPTRERPRIVYASELPPPRSREAPEKTRRVPGLGETVIMSTLALLFLVAGLAAAGLSGFANYQAFSGLVTDPMQARVWGWAGVIASVCSFGGFTFFWWHSTHGRWREAVRTVLFALAGAGASFAGTALFMEQQSAERGQMASQVAIERDVVEAQIADWSAQLQGIPADIRSVEGLEAYTAEVERVGRTYQKPYRDAMNELGLARRRAALEADIAEARDRLITLASARGAAAQVQTIPSWGFALLLELFSSQATSIACVSLLLLFGARSQARQTRHDPD